MDRGCVGGRDASNLPFKLMTSRMVIPVMKDGGLAGVARRDECPEEQRGEMVDGGYSRVVVEIVGA